MRPAPPPTPRTEADSLRSQIATSKKADSVRVGLDVSRRRQIDSPAGACHKRPVDEQLAVTGESRIARRITLVRGHRVMLDRDLAVLYGVSTKSLNQQVRRNVERFPSDFMFQLTSGETESLRSQFVTSNRRRGGRRYFPYAFTEQGVAMLSGVLTSRRAVLVNVEIMRTFVRLRQILSSHAELARKLEELEQKYDSQFRVVFDAIRELMSTDQGESRPIGFRPP